MKTCKVCYNELKGNAKKEFCNSTCRVRWFRSKSWVNINNIDEDLSKKILDLKKKHD